LRQRRSVANTLDFDITVFSVIVASYAETFIFRVAMKT